MKKNSSVCQFIFVLVLFFFTIITITKFGEQISIKPSLAVSYDNELAQAFPSNTVCGGSQYCVPSVSPILPSGNPSTAPSLPDASISAAIPSLSISQAPCTPVNYQSRDSRARGHHHHPKHGGSGGNGAISSFIQQLLNLLMQLLNQLIALLGGQPLPIGPTPSSTPNPSTGPVPSSTVPNPCPPSAAPIQPSIAPLQPSAAPSQPAFNPSGTVSSPVPSAPAAISGSIPFTAGWRSSDYGMQDPQAICQGPGAYSGACTVQPSYWVNAAKGMAAKFPGSQPGGVYTVGFIQNNGIQMPSQLQGDLGTMGSVTYSAAGQQADPEVMLSAFDAAGLKIILAIEPGNADINVLATKILNKYKNHPSVIGFGMDNEWYKGEKGTVAMTAAEATAFRDTIEAVNPNYVTMIKHFNSAMLPPNIARVIYLTDTCNFSSLSAAVDDYVAWANTFSGNRVGYQVGYDAFETGSPDDQAWWGPLGTNGDPAVAITNAILAKRPGTDIYMIYWADFTIKTQFPAN